MVAGRLRSLLTGTADSSTSTVPTRFATVDASTREAPTNVIATNVRTRILEEKNWEQLVPTAVASLVKQFDGVGRVRSITMKDVGGD